MCVSSSLFEWFHLVAKALRPDIYDAYGTGATRKRFEQFFADFPNEAKGTLQHPRIERAIRQMEKVVELWENEKDKKFTRSGRQYGKYCQKN